MNALLTLNIIVLALLAWLSLVWIVPSCATSRFRYRAWRIRDEVVDELRAGRYEERDEPEAFVQTVETAIEEAAVLSFLKVSMFGIATRKLEFKPPFRLDGLSENDATLLRAHITRMDEAAIDKALFGSPSGWIAVVLVLPLLLVSATLRALFRGHSKGGSVFKDAKQHVREDFEMDVALALTVRSGGHGHHRALHQYV